jgi:hypothetical protein
MTSVIDTLGKAARHGMIIRAECQGCGNARFYRASDLMMHFGGGRDPRSLKFRCDRCRPKVVVTVLEVDYDRLAKITVYKPEPPLRGEGPVVWMPSRLK